MICYVCKDCENNDNFITYETCEPKKEDRKVVKVVCGDCKSENIKTYEIK